ncbi:glycosyltransferase [Bacillus sp. 1P10SD]|uniref:glycosyltransferase family 2 protein n=1 Tax=Bacillus sp. 1P10SD TaxID=3132265 RepID=UPI0039A69DD2
MLVSMVMAVYNGQKFLREALNCALAQTYPNLEIIIVNDGSTDSTAKILDKLDDSRVKVIHLHQNQGAANALNLAISHAKGEWIAIQDADDNSFPDRIKEQVQYIHDCPELVGVGTLVRCISGNPDVPDAVYEEWTRGRNRNVSRKAIKKVIYSTCPLTHSSVMFSKKVFQKVGGYDQRFRIAYDYDLWLKLVEHGELEKIPQVLIDYRIYQSSLSHKDFDATSDEIQLAASRAIFRLKQKGKDHQPKVILMGEKTTCEKYLRNIVPSTHLLAETIIYENFRKKLPSIIRKIKSGKLDAMILLNYNHNQKILRNLVRNGLKLNKDFFVLFNPEQ